VIPIAANGIMGGPLRDLANNLTRAYIDERRRQPPAHRCHAPPPPPFSGLPKGALDWRRSLTLELLDLVATSVGPSGLDELVSTATGPEPEPKPKPKPKPGPKPEPKPTPKPTPKPKPKP
jgi:hypothetical protein